MCRLYEYPVFNEGGHTNYGSNVDDLNGFYFVPVGGENKGGPRSSDVCKNCKKIKFK